MSLAKIDLILHPVRFRILTSFGQEPLNTQDIADRLKDIPKSSIYRHLKVLLDAKMLHVADTRQIKGIEEKFYQLSSPPRLSPSDMANLTADEHIRYFTTYAMTLIRGFADYLQMADESGGVDFLSDRVGYTEVAFYSTQAEFDEFQVAINQAMMKLIHNKPENGRIQRKIAVITHPNQNSEA